MNKLVKGYLLLIGYVALGMSVLYLVRQINVAGWSNSPVYVFLAFLIVNFLFVYFLKLDKAKTEYWSAKKVNQVFIGMLIGGFVMVFPYLVYWLLGEPLEQGIDFQPHFKVSAIATTLIIVGWEELWFRGIFLNHCKKYFTTIHLSVAVGVLFMLIHTLNPNVSMLKTGPTLFLAGATLTLLYFYFKSIWLPLGIHFGNNYFSSYFSTGISNHWIFGNEGYLSATVLAVIFVVFAFRTAKRESRDSPDQLQT